MPPGQYIVQDFPVLSAGPTPHTPATEWTFAVVGGAQPTTWTWEEFRALPSEEIRADIHCVTKWTKLDTSWEGVSVDTLLDGIDHDATHVLAFSDGDYTTNLPLEDVSDGKAWVAFGYDGRAARPGARWPRAAARPAPLLLEERQMGPWPAADGPRRGRLLGVVRLPHVRGPMARAAVRGRLSWTLGDVVELIDETPRVQDHRARRAGVAWPPCGAARRRAPHRRGRLPGAAQLLDRVGAGRRPPRDHRRGPARRRGLVVPGRRAAGRRQARAPRSDRRLLRLGGGPHRAAAPGRRRVGRRAADVDDPPPACGGGDRTRRSSCSRRERGRT